MRYSFLLLALLVAAVASAQVGSFERPPIDYHNTEVHDPVARLAARVASGEVTLAYDKKSGYLKSLLEALEVPISSQGLVFSKTSLQIRRISPHHPRAVYFNDEVYVGFCQQGEVIELAATDPNQGALFYSLQQNPDDLPRFVRDRGQCLTCHASSRTQDVPGYLVRSVFADYGGHAILGSGTFVSDSTSPFRERWGGWYVTGTHGAMRHMGNQAYANGAEPYDLEKGANIESLDGIVATGPYLSPHSDLVALMVFEHQTQMHNAITAANYTARQTIDYAKTMNQLLDREPDHLSESDLRQLDRAADRVVRYLLLCDEFQLTDRVAGTSGFAEEFAERGIRDAKGRSLRDLDLDSRLFRYPCSFLVYSPAFDALPEEVRIRVAERLTKILSGEETSPKYAHLSADDRLAILEILRDTKPGLLGK